MGKPKKIDVINATMMKKYKKNKSERDPIKAGFNVGYVNALDNLRYQKPKDRKSFINSSFKIYQDWSKEKFADYDIENRSSLAGLKGSLAAISDLKKIENRFGYNVFGYRKKNRFKKVTQNKRESAKQ